MRPMARVSPKGLSLIKRFEGLGPEWATSRRIVAYLDPVGIPTIGYGHTGPDVTMDDVGRKEITLEQAELLLRADLKRFEDGVQNFLTRAATQAQFDAMVSLAYNIGLSAFKKSTVLERFNAGDIEGAAEAFILFSMAGGQLLRGLVYRRAAEIVRFMGK